ncbi:MAG: HD domain-containing protein [Hydrogenophaga sp.]|uniref:HD domain-containing protein n=1 Tax=Hydrogenophaga sp. TaxID=1904254 RepID=UPI0026133BDB|nr:HD domain-containing protein [Hydrogenophaga sp.]MDM7942206.1 HD domain-containing protein [Hydrogenophaga sp.]
MTLDDIEAVLLREGAARYGRESVSQLDHALQCAHLAEQAAESPATIAAALLHDLGHLVRPPQEGMGGAAPDSRDDLHQFIALPFLRATFDDAVLEPIRLHVDAKRYLCHADPAYLGTLSAASVHSLRLQGGVFAAGEAAAFVRQPHAPTAVRLRRYDDLAKVPGARTPSLGHFLERMRALVLPAG